MECFQLKYCFCTNNVLVSLKQTILDEVLHQSLSMGNLKLFCLRLKFSCLIVSCWFFLSVAQPPCFHSDISAPSRPTLIVNLLFNGVSSFATIRTCFNAQEITKQRRFYIVNRQRLPPFVFCLRVGVGVFSSLFLHLTASVGRAKKNYSIEIIILMYNLWLLFFMNAFLRQKYVFI